MRLHSLSVKLAEGPYCTNQEWPSAARLNQDLCDCTGSTRGVDHCATKVAPLRGPPALDEQQGAECLTA